MHVRWELERDDVVELSEGRSVCILVGKVGIEIAFAPSVVKELNMHRNLILALMQETDPDNDEGEDAEDEDEEDEEDEDGDTEVFECDCEFCKNP